MYTRTLKTAGAAALGVAFAAVAAGPAVASPVDSVLKQMPLEKSVQSLPGAAQTVGVTKSTVGYTTSALPATPRTLPAAAHGARHRGPQPNGGAAGALTGALPKGVGTAVPGASLGLPAF
jgi:hypothetical protein